MPIKMRAKDGTIQSFPDGTSEPALRMAMLAYDNKDSWGGMAGHVAKALGQKAEVQQQSGRQSGASDVVATATIPQRGGNGGRSASVFEPTPQENRRLRTARNMFTGMPTNIPSGSVFEPTSEDRVQAGRAMFANMPQQPDPSLRQVDVKMTPQTGLLAAASNVLRPIRGPLQKALVDIEQRAAARQGPMPSPSEHPIRDVLIRSLWDGNTNAGMRGGHLVISRRQGCRDQSEVRLRRWRTSTVEFTL